jgi:hypothetical protein
LEVILNENNNLLPENNNNSVCFDLDNSTKL